MKKNHKMNEYYAYNMSITNEQEIAQCNEWNEPPTEKKEDKEDEDKLGSKAHTIF